MTTRLNLDIPDDASEAAAEELARAQKLIEDLDVALHAAIREPMGIVPRDAENFYDPDHWRLKSGTEATYQKKRQEFQKLFSKSVDNHTKTTYQYAQANTFIHRLVAIDRPDLQLVNRLVSELNLDDFETADIVFILRAFYAFRSKITGWDEFVHVGKYVIDSRGEKSQILLKGLLD